MCVCVCLYTHTHTHMYLHTPTIQKFHCVISDTLLIECLIRILQCPPGQRGERVRLGLCPCVLVGEQVGILRVAKSTLVVPKGDPDLERRD